MNPKLQTYRNKIIENENALKEVEPPYIEARGKFEKFLNLNGIELLNEWGILGADFKLVKKHKNGGIEEEKDAKVETKVHELDLDLHDKSFLNNTVKPMRKKANTITKTPEKNTKHKIIKYGKLPETNGVSSVHQVNLEDIGDINSPEKVGEIYVSPKLSESTEKINRRIEKRHLNKAYKTVATINEKEELWESTAKHIVVDLSDPLNKTTNSDYGTYSSGENKGLTADALRTTNLGSKRSGLGSSLINFAMEGKQIRLYLF